MAPDPDRASATLAAIRAIEQAATEGPWRAVAGLWATDGGKQEIFPAVISSCGDPAKAETWLMAAGRGSPNPEANAEFAAAARTAMPRLLAAAEAVLKLADDWATERPGEIGPGYNVTRACGHRLRETIAAALAGREAGDGLEARP